MPLEENRYLGRKLTHYQHFKEDPKSGLHQIRRYSPKIKFDPIHAKKYDKFRKFDEVKYDNKPTDDILAQKTKQYTAKNYDHFYEYNQAQDEKEEKKKEVVRVREKKVKKTPKKTDDDDETFFPEGLWKGTIGTVRRGFLLLYQNPKTPSPMQQGYSSPDQSETSSPVQIELLTPTAIGSLDTPKEETSKVETPKKETLKVETPPKVTPKKVVIQEKPIVMPETFEYSAANSETARSTTLVPSLININYSSKNWNNF